MIERTRLRQLGLKPVINAIGYATPLGNGRLDEATIEAMVEGARHFVSIAELQKAVGRRLAEITHAEAGYVVSGAAAGLTLATAACIAGLNPSIMNRLPDAGPSVPRTVVVHRAHRYDYDHAVRQAGAELREVGFPNLTFPYELSEAIREDTVAVLFRGDGTRNVVPFGDVIEIARSRDVPVIVDAALTVPPVENLWRYIDNGADLVVFSGGKAIGGPPASGFVVGKADLIASIALQHQDMDVRVETWSKESYGQTVVDPPYQGIGRPMKVGKEQVLGLLTAINQYVERDHLAELEGWRAQVARIRDRLADEIPGLPTVIEEGSGDPPNYVPQLRLDLGSRGEAARVSRLLALRDPSVYCNEGGLWDGSLIVVPSCIREEEESELVKALVQEVSTAPSDHLSDRQQRSEQL